MSEQDRDITSAHSFRWLCWLLAPLLLFLPWPFIGTLAFLGNSDALFYSNILTMTSDALKAGVIFPRWLPEANAGFGSPVMMFYAPLAYLITAIINLPLTPLHLSPGLQLAVGIYASQVFSGWSCFLWLKRSFSERTALIGSLLFILLPYKLIYIYLHINLAQLWALSLLPLWMMAAEDIVGGKVRAIGTYSLCAAGAYYMHPLTVIAFAWVPALQALWFGRQRFGKTLGLLFLAHLLAAAMCVAQAVPGQTHLAWIHSSLFFSGNYDWRKNLFHVDVVLCAYYGLIALLVGVAALRIPALKETIQGRKSLFWIAVLLVVLFLTQRISSFLWEAVPLLRYLQFPAARLHAPALLAAIWLICFWLDHVKEMLPLGGLAYGRTTLVLLIMAFTCMTGWRVYKVESDPKEASEEYLEKGLASKVISTPVPLYVTQWECIDAGRAFRLYEAEKLPPSAAVAFGGGTVFNLSWNPPDRIAFDAAVWSDTAVVAVRQCYWPLWQAMDNTTGKPLLLQPIRPDGLMAMSLRRGNHSIVITLSTPPKEQACRIVSLLALLTALGIVMLKNNRFLRPSKSNYAAA